jgi:uncharacterized protein YggL (DUF469 family)
MPTLQLELNLWQQLAEAQQSPQAVDWQQLCLAFDEAIAQTPERQKLATAADAIAEMADVFAARADEFFSTWHRQRVAHEGPILDDDLFAEFVRQSFHLDLDGLVGVPELYVRSASEKSHEEIESVVAEVSKETALLLAGAEMEPEPMIVVQPYDENVGEWANAIALWMRQRKLERVGFVELLDGVGYPVVKGWLAVLLDEGFAINRLEGSDFYRSAGILVALKREVRAIAC